MAAYAAKEHPQQFDSTKPFPQIKRRPESGKRYIALFEGWGYNHRAGHRRSRRSAGGTCPSCALNGRQCACHAFAVPLACAMLPLPTPTRPACRRPPWRAGGHRQREKVERAGLRATGGTVSSPSDTLSYFTRAYADLGQFNDAWCCISAAMTAVAKLPKKGGGRPS